MKMLNLLVGLRASMLPLTDMGMGIISASTLVTTDSEVISVSTGTFDDEVPLDHLARQAFRRRRVVAERLGGLRPFRCVRDRERNFKKEKERRVIVSSLSFFSFFPFFSSFGSGASYVIYCFPVSFFLAFLISYEYSLSFFFFFWSFCSFSEHPFFVALIVSFLVPFLFFSTLFHIKVSLRGSFIIFYFLSVFFFLSLVIHSFLCSLHSIFSR